MFEAERIRIALAISSAIEEGQLLGARPSDDADLIRHETAVPLLDVLRDILRGGPAEKNQPYIVEVRINPTFVDDPH